MALQSGMVPLGTPLPEATLPDLDATLVDVHAYSAGNPLLVAFLCNHCPYVRWIEQDLGVVVRAASGLRTLAINPNAAEEYPQDSPAAMREQATRAGWDFPYLVDAGQTAARDFGAVCTPDFFLYDAGGLLVYRGAFDGSTPKNGRPRTGDLLAAAITDVLAGRPVPEPHRPSMGCSIKWRQS